MALPRRSVSLLAAGARSARRSGCWCACSQTRRRVHPQSCHLALNAVQSQRMNQSHRMRSTTQTIRTMPPVDSTKSTALRVPFGFRNGRMWSPQQVTNGLSCGCVCPACGSPLQARNQGSKRRAYFAHHADHACSGAYESAVHRMAKQLICERLHLTLPAWDGAEDMPNPPTAVDDSGQRLLGKPVNYPARAVQLMSANAEIQHVDYRPDVSAKDEDGELLIEIRVSHSVTDLKSRRVQSEGRRMIEIDLSRVTAKQAEDSFAFEALVLDTAENRRWISCPPATEAWRVARNELATRLAARNRKIADNEGKHRELALRKAQKEQERKIWRDQERAAFREPYVDDLKYLLQASRPEAIAEKYAALQSRDEAEAEQILTLVPDSLHPALSTSTGSAWAYGAHYLLWQPAMYLQFIAGRPTGHPVSRTELGRWLRATYGVDPVLWKLFMTQWQGRKQARQLGRKQWSLFLWYFTEEENRAIPNFFDCVTVFLNKLISAGVLEQDPEPGGDLVVAARNADGSQMAARKLLPQTPHIDPLFDTGVDSYLGRWISHTKLGVGIIRDRVAKGSPTYNIWFNGAMWRSVWLGNPASGDWRLLDEGVSEHQLPPGSDTGGP